MSERSLPSLKRGRLLLGGFLFLLFLLFLGRWGVVLYVDLLWFGAQGLLDVFVTRTLWEWGARGLVGGAAALLTWVNLRIVATSFQGLQIRRRFGDLVIQEQVPESYVRLGILVVCVLIGLWFAMAVPQGTGLRGLLLFHAEPWGEVDPILGRDIGFYLFLLPVLQGLVTFGLVLTVFLATMIAAGYTATGAIRWGDNRLHVAHVPRQHLAAFAGVFLVLLGTRFYLAPYDLVLSGNSAVQGIFGYADYQARIPAYRMVAFLALVVAAVGFWGVRTARLLPVAAGSAALAIAALALGQIYPGLVQRFQVQPNELARETEFIEDAVRFTRWGFGLDRLDRSRLDYRVPDAESWSLAQSRLARLPVWTPNTLLTTFRQLEARFQYYDFHEVAFDRYPSGTGMEPVAVSVRELDPTGIPDPNWQNLHLRQHYISGMGAVAGQLHRHTGDGRLPMFLTAIPPEYRPGPEVPDGLDLTRPAVYVGTRPHLYAVINRDAEGFEGPDGQPGEPGVDFPAGIQVGSIFRTLALAWRFQDANLLLASEVGSDSRLVIRRQVQERVRALAPFLYLPEAPYPVVADGRIVWVIEGFTLSRSFPLSRAHQIPGQQTVNYLRNSVKGTVDALTGEVRLYVADPNDPLIQAYRSGFPSLFHDMSEVPAMIGRHFRYSRYQLEAQTEILLRFHQESPPVFHGQQDQWALATELSVGSQPVAYRPEYSLLTLPGEAAESYVLSTLFVPQGRQNLASFVVARWSPDQGGELRLWDLPLEDQFPGPRQIEALVEQDPEISQQFSLWRQGGSQVWTGHLHLVPVGTTLIYMEPIFLAADVDAIPEIRRFVVSDGRRVVMDTSLSGAISALAIGMGGVVAMEVPDELGDTDLPGVAIPDLSATGLDSREALEMLERAESSLREGDWEGFGRGLEELRTLLQRHLEAPQP